MGSVSYNILCSFAKIHLEYNKKGRSRPCIYRDRDGGTGFVAAWNSINDFAFTCFDIRGCWWRQWKAKKEVSWYCMSYSQSNKINTIKAGEKALRSLRDIKETLSKANERGMLDVFGPLSLSSSRKNALIDEAKRGIKRAEDDLKSFAKAITALSSETDIRLDDISEFADKLFSNPVFLDKAKIDRFDKQVNEGIKKVEALLKTLK